MGISNHQALELLDQALASGASTPQDGPRVLLSKPEHTTRIGQVLFDADGDVRVRFPAFAAAADHALGPPAR